MGNSVDITFYNNTHVKWVRTNYDLHMSEGTADPYPPLTIHPEETVRWGAHGVVSGCEGYVIYRLDGTTDSKCIYSNQWIIKIHFHLISFNSNISYFTSSIEHPKGNAATPKITIMLRGS